MRSEGQHPYHNLRKLSSNIFVSGAPAAVTFIVTTSICNLVTGFYSLKYGQNSRTSGILFDNNVQFSDLTDVIASASAATLYGEFGPYPFGISYPPGASSLVAVLNQLGLEASKLVYVIVCVAAIASLFIRIPMSKRERVLSIITTTACGFITYKYLDNYALVVFLMSLASISFILVSFCCRHKQSLIFCALGMTFSSSFPFAFALDRMNADVVTFAILVFSYTLIRSDKWRSSIVGIACAIKLVPVFYLLPPRLKVGSTVRYFIQGVSVAIVFTLLSILVRGENIIKTITGFRESLHYFEMTYVDGGLGDRFSWSAINFVGQISRISNSPSYQQIIYDWYHTYLPLAPFLIVAIAVVCQRFRLPEWSYLMAITGTFVLLQPASFGYRGLYFFIPIILIIESQARLSALSVDRCADGIKTAATTTGLTVALVAAAIAAKPQAFGVMIDIQTTLSPPLLVAGVTLSLVAGFRSRQQDCVGPRTVPIRNQFRI